MSLRTLILIECAGKTPKITTCLNLFLKSFWNVERIKYWKIYVQINRKKWCWKFYYPCVFIVITRKIDAKDAKKDMINFKTLFSCILSRIYITYELLTQSKYCYEKTWRSFKIFFIPVRMKRNFHFKTFFFSYFPKQNSKISNQHIPLNYCKI